MQEPTQFYKSQIVKRQEELQTVKQRLFVSSMLRLTLFLLACAGIYFMWGDVQIIILIALVTIGAFVFLVSKHSNLQYKRDFLQQLIKINETEIRVQKRDFHDLPSGEKYKNPNHAFSLDIDLFGRGSFFQYLNRTALLGGANKLAQYLTANEVENIPEKQEAIKELAEKPHWRQSFSTTASLVKTDMSAEEIVIWLKNYQTFVPKTMRFIPLIFSVLSLGLFILSYFGLVTSQLIVLWLFVGLGITGAYFKKVTALSDKSGKAQSTFEQYYKLLLQLEREELKSPWLQYQLAKIKPKKGPKASSVLKDFSRMLSALDQRNNLIVGFIINGFFLSDLRNGYRIEKWMKTNSQNVEDWFDVIAFFDAYNSLGNFAFNHPKFVFPEINQNREVLNAKQAVHPLLDSAKAIKNDFRINEEEFFIVTGANMAGKSTFLRTVSLQIVMGNVGLPVRATSASYSPIKLITSMRTTDSLTDDESYFFSELKRLKYIVDAIKTDRYFIILDEILKGTNSTDKAIGSRKFINKLVASNSTGIIATHDLSLCEAANDLEEVKNYYFDAQIKDGELFFDYTFKKGICQNMNASFLLQKMGIV